MTTSDHTHGSVRLCALTASRDRRIPLNAQQAAVAIGLAVVCCSRQHPTNRCDPTLLPRGKSAITPFCINGMVLKCACARHGATELVVRSEYIPRRAASDCSACSGYRRCKGWVPRAHCLISLKEPAAARIHEALRVSVRTAALLSEVAQLRLRRGRQGLRWNAVWRGIN